MLDTIKTPLCVIHTITPKAMVVSKNVAYQHLVQSKETRLVVFPGSILLISHLITNLCVCKNFLSNQFVIDFVLWMHQLDQSHILYVDPSYPFKDFNICNVM